MAEVRVFVIMQTVDGGQDRPVAVRLSRETAEDVARASPDLYVRRFIASRDGDLNQYELRRVIAPQQSRAA